YHAALARSPEARVAFVAAACGGDETVRREVVSLLKYAGSPDPFVEGPACDRPARLIAGQTLGHYVVGAPLGAGGMGELYRGYDTLLRRDVAIKVAASSGAERLRRFEVEARAAAALVHPNIVTIYSIERAHGRRFLTMELIEGTPLGSRIPRHGFPLGH